MVLVSFTTPQGTVQEYNSLESDEVVIRESPDGQFIDLSFEVPDGPTVLVTFSKRLLLDPDTNAPII